MFAGKKVAAKDTREAATPGFCGEIKYEVKKKRLTNVGIGDILTRELGETNLI